MRRVLVQEWVSVDGVEDVGLAVPAGDHAVDGDPLLDQDAVHATSLSAFRGRSADPLH